MRSLRCNEALEKSFPCGKCSCRCQKAVSEERPVQILFVERWCWQQLRRGLGKVQVKKERGQKRGLAVVGPGGRDGRGLQSSGEEAGEGP